MPFPRMTTRRWMIAVAVLGLILASVVIGGRLSDERELRLMRMNSCDRIMESARENAGFQREQFFSIEKLLSKAAEFHISPSEAAEYRERIPGLLAGIEKSIAQAKRCESLKPRYKYFADHPWLPLPSDMPGSPWLAVPPPESD